MSRKMTEGRTRYAIRKGWITDDADENVCGPLAYETNIRTNNEQKITAPCDIEQNTRVV